MENHRAAAHTHGVLYTVTPLHYAAYITMLTMAGCTYVYGCVWLDDYFILHLHFFITHVPCCNLPTLFWYSPLGSLTIACLACHRIQVGVHIQCMGSIHYNCVYIVATVTCAQFAHVYIYGGAVLTG